MDRFVNSFLNSSAFLRRDRKYYTILIAVLTMVLVTLVISAIAVWPVIFGVARSGGTAAEIASFFRILGIVAVVASLLVSLGIPRDNYSFLKATTLGYAISSLVLMIMFWARNITLPGLEASNFYMGLMRIVIGFPVGAVLALLPAFIGNVVGWIVWLVVQLLASR